MFKKKVEAIRNCFHIIVDYGQSPSAMIEAGRYDRFTGSVRYFPIQRQDKIELDVELVHYGKRMKSDKVIRELDSCGLLPASAPDLLAFGSTYPDKQREFPIIALGSVWWHWEGFRGVVSLGGNSSERRVYLDAFDDKWIKSCRFLAVRK